MLKPNIPLLKVKHFIVFQKNIFPIHQMGIFAYNDWDNDKTNTTILGRPLEGRSTIRNDRLSV